ncbi:hypothetical protein NLJ89_g1902 [Agrocybe chaxingu]|uniref:DUF6534 domain-containing protein n=1 Tax=Agrocybe chaxingu TaxID=84603 RepID=A0A9W8MZ57_9AGAR|nr:hypothetical protein NLJ89_g1902 [Agrocybe chaxingu]
MSLSGLIPALDNSFGAIFIGMTIAGGLWGITTAQTYWYYTTYPKDPMGWKLLVAVVWALDTVHQALISSLLYHYLITNYFNPYSLDRLLPALLVQCFFLFRIWRLSKGKWYLLILPAFFIGSKFVVGVVWIAKAATRTSITDANNRYHTLVQYAQGSAMAGDILLAGTMVYLLYTSRTGHKHSNSMINKLMLYAINTGAVTSICAILTLMCVLAFPGTYIYGAFYFCVGRLYVNSMLASLNARKPLMKKTTFLEMSVTGDSSGHIHSKTQPHGELTKKSNAYEEPKLGVYVNTTKSTVLDIA